MCFLFRGSPPPTAMMIFLGFPSKPQKNVPSQKERAGTKKKNRSIPIHIYLDPQKGTLFCSLRYFCSFCQLSGISEICVETANFMFRTHCVAKSCKFGQQKCAEIGGKCAEIGGKCAEIGGKCAEIGGKPKTNFFEHGWSNRNVCFLGK